MSTKTERDRLTVVETKIDNISDKLDDFIKESKEDRKRFVSVERYKPVEKIVYGLVTIIVTGVATAVLGLVLTR